MNRSCFLVVFDTRIRGGEENKSQCKNEREWMHMIISKVHDDLKDKFTQNSLLGGKSKQVMHSLLNLSTNIRNIALEESVIRMCYLYLRPGRMSSSSNEAFCSRSCTLPVVLTASEGDVLDMRWWMLEGSSRCSSMAMASWISLSTSEMDGLSTPLGFTHIVATSAIFHTDCRSYPASNDWSMMPWISPLSMCDLACQFTTLHSASLSAPLARISLIIHYQEERLNAKFMYHHKAYYFLPIQQCYGSGAQSCHLRLVHGLRLAQVKWHQNCTYHSSLLAAARYSTYEHTQKGWAWGTLGIRCYKGI